MKQDAVDRTHVTWHLAFYAFLYFNHGILDFSIDTEGECWKWAKWKSHRVKLTEYVIFQNVMHLQDWADWERPDIACQHLVHSVQSQKSPASCSAGVTIFIHVPVHPMVIFGKQAREVSINWYCRSQNKWCLI